jgi:glycosidase
MPWDAGPGHGFTTGRPWLRFGDDADVRNVTAQEDDPDSVLATYRRLIALRRSTEALRTGTLQLLRVDTPDVTAWARQTDGERIVVVVDFADAEREARLPGGATYRPIGGSHLEPSSPDADGVLRLRPFEAVILRAD